MTRKDKRGQVLISGSVANIQRALGHGYRVNIHWNCGIIVMDFREPCNMWPILPNNQAPAHTPLPPSFVQGFQQQVQEESRRLDRLRPGFRATLRQISLVVKAKHKYQLS